MDVCLFLIATERATTEMAQTVDPQTIHDIAATFPGIKRVVVHMPVEGGANDPYLHAEAPPRCTLQLYFDSIDALENVLREGGKAHALLNLPGLKECDLTQQVMAVRRFPVPDPGSLPADDTRCSYMVSYEGPAEDLNAWLGHYIDSHPPIMARFPGIREIEIYTRMDYRGALPVARSNAMQRNKVVFDSPDALNAALASPVRHEMRADFKNFPPFSGASPHFPAISIARDFKNA
ncbi:EthD family reductase [Caballeronia sp. SEWSISQ10-4 2]|uniref:EthD family reductase n=1 Tax=Caballeronia sp. SEWSISQ10-4 2 TaxID=2937438 RepID=UPI002656EBB8|nr:EthD family reductase [Caballeronia sp. SEWSISQ10-4 2]MDN7178331.1 EthD family reductase [Caballeronia sp. SEWSISQ10-4 2]